MFARSIHNRKDIQKILEYEVKLNPKCVTIEFEYIAVKYIPLD